MQPAQQPQAQAPAFQAQPQQPAPAQPKPGQAVIDESHYVKQADDNSKPGKRTFIVCGTKFEVDAKYKIIKPIGHGAYGVVWYGFVVLWCIAHVVHGLVKAVLLGLYYTCVVVVVVATLLSAVLDCNAIELASFR